MKPTTLLIGTLALATIGLTILYHSDSQEVNNLGARAQFSLFMDTHNKSYSTSEEKEYRFGVFMDNLREIEELKKTRTFEVGVNQFSDLTWDEFKSAYLAEPTYNEVVGGEEINFTVDPIDWREKKVVSRVKNQAMCGSCWAFSTTGSFEGILAINGKGLVDLSEQELVDCSRSYGNMGCNGGLMTYAYKYIKDHGLTDEAHYPYTARNGVCKGQGFKPRYKVSAFETLSARSTEKLSDLLKKNPVSVALEVQRDFQAYRGGVYKNSNCGRALNHGVLLVGQKDNYYVVKNSWGGSWGEQGYIRMEITSGSGTCGIANPWDVIPTKL